MAISAREAAVAHFAGSEGGYDEVQVDAYVTRVVETLAAQERQLAEARAEISRLEHALDLAHAAQAGAPAIPPPGTTGRVLGEALATAGADQVELTPGAAPPTPDRGERLDELASWIEAQSQSRAVKAELEGAGEDARRLRGIANALAAEAAIARHGVQVGLSPTAQEAAELRALETLEAAEAEAAQLLDAALVEARSIVAKAQDAAAAVTRTAEREAQDLSRRTAQLRVALRDAGARFAELAGDTRAEIKMLVDFIDLEMHGVDQLEDAGAVRDGTIDLRSEAQGVDGSGPADTGAQPPANPGFYERRLAGLRERLENS